MIDDPNAPENSASEVDDLLHKKDFGASLRLAREKSTMSLTDVAQKLLISVDIIKALENSQTDALPAITFTQGYIRSYARLLGVPADEIINDYVYMVPNSEQILVSNSVLPAQKCCNDKVVKLITFGFILVAVIVLVFWFVNTDFKIKSELIKSKFISSELIDSELIDSGPESNSHAANELTTQAAPTENALTVSTKKSVEVEVQKNTSEISIEPSLVQPVEIEKENNETASNADTLILSALAGSWCEIQDATGKRLYYRLLNRGEEIELSGTAPFMVFLGNAPKIRVEVNNKIVDFENLINRNSNIASLQISKDAIVTSPSNQ